MDKINWIRRIIIIICLIILTITGLISLPESKYIDINIKAQVDAKKAQVIEVGKRMKMDKDTLLIKRIINTQDKTYIRYAFIKFEQGSFFPENAMKIFDDKGNPYRCNASSSPTKLWGQDGLIQFDRIDKDAKYIILKLEWYDRENEMKIPLENEGESDESK